MRARPTSEDERQAIAPAGPPRIASASSIAVHLGHPQVEDRDVERARPPRPSRAPRAASRCRATPSPSDAAGRRGSGGSSRCRRRRGPAGRRARPGRSGGGDRPSAAAAAGSDDEVERAALAGARPRSPPSATPPIELGEAPADRQAEAGPAEPARDAGVGLAEALEQPAHPVRRDADARCRGRRPSSSQRVRTPRGRPAPDDRQHDLARAR